MGGAGGEVDGDDGFVDVLLASEAGEFVGAVPGCVEACLVVADWRTEYNTYHECSDGMCEDCYDDTFENYGADDELTDDDE